MTTNIAILKVLSSYQDGQASIAALKADLAMLSTREWLARMRALSALCRPISLFGDKLVTRDANGWAITQAGRDFLEELEHRARVVQQKPELAVISSSPSTAIASRRLQSSPLKLLRSA